jgi:DNA-binding response OmpR family regulator
MSKTIMVLEDEDVLFGLLQDLLAFEGYLVVKPEKIENLLNEMRLFRPDAMLIDVNLKGANGLDILGQVRADNELKEMPVFVSSGMDYRAESMERGADAFLMKPYMPDELVNLLKQKFG